MRTLAPLLAVAAILVGGSARADDSERAASVSAGFATYATPDAKMEETLTPTAGLALAATYERALGTEVSWRTDLVLAGYLGGGAAATGQATLGLVYRIDVLKYVPYVDVGVGALVRAGGPFTAGVEPALRIGGGVDLLRSRARSVGLAAAVTSFASDTTTVTVAVRSTWRWGYF